MAKSKSRPSYRDAKRAQLNDAGVVRIFGVELDGGDDERKSLTIWYCGFSLGDQDHRQGTKRIWHVRRSDVRDSGKVAGFEYEGNPVEWYAVEPHASIVEERYHPVDITGLLYGDDGGMEEIARLALGGRRWRLGAEGDIPVTISPSPTAPITQKPPTTIQP